MVELDQLTQRPEHLDAQHQHDQQRAELQVAVVDPHRAQAESHRGARRDAEKSNGAGSAVRGQHAHGAPVEASRAIYQQHAPLPALPEGLQGEQALDAVQKLRSEGSVGVTSRYAAAPAPPVQQRRYKECQNREPKKDQGYLRVKGRHEPEYEHGRDRRHEHLRQVLAEERLKALDALNQGHQSVAGAALVEVARAKSEGVLVEVSSKLDLDGGRRMMADRIADVLEQAAQYDERRDRRQRGDQCRERRPSEHLRDDDARDGQAGYAGDNGGQPDGSRQQDPQSQALRHRDQSQVKVH